MSPLDLHIQIAIPIWIYKRHLKVNMFQTECLFFPHSHLQFFLLSLILLSKWKRQHLRSDQKPWSHN